MRAWRRAILALVLLAPLAAPAQQGYPFDVPYVPTPPVVVEEMLRLAAVGAGDFVIDLGSGDGRLVIAAARLFGARGVGVDLDAERIAESRDNAAAAGVAGRVGFEQADLFRFDLAPATVVTLYLLPTVNARLRPRLLDLAPGTRIVSHDFDLGDWQPDARSTVRKNVFLWVVPARVAGRWRIEFALPGGPRSVDVEFRQKHQQVEGLVRAGGRIEEAWNARLDGTRLRFTLVDAAGGNDSNLYFDGRVAGDAIEGTLARGLGAAQIKTVWRATRLADGSKP